MSSFSKSDINAALSIAAKTGKILFGSNVTVKNAMTGKVKLVVISSNCPKDERERIKRHCKLSEIPVIIYPGSSLDLGSACGKTFSVSSLAIRDPGDSDILKFTGGGNV